jgi:type II secretion system (T2SS) protein E
MPRCADTSCRRWRLFGALQFNGNAYCSRACVEQAVLAGLGEVAAAAPRGRALPPMKLGVLLRHAGAITDAQLAEALDAQSRTGLRLGEQLAQLGHAASDAVLRALAMQAGVSYLSNFDVERVMHAPGALSPAMVRALGLVPFDMDAAGERLKVISAAPLPRAAIRAMAKLTGWTIDAYLVTDTMFEAALDAYQPADQRASGDAGTLRTLDAAAARVAERAARDRAVTMKHVAYDDYVWVRVEGPGQVSDLLVSKELSGPHALTRCESQRGVDSGVPAARTERPVLVDEGDSTKCQAVYTAR